MLALPGTGGMRQHLVNGMLLVTLDSVLPISSLQSHAAVVVPHVMSDLRVCAPAVPPQMRDCTAAPADGRGFDAMLQHSSCAADLWSLYVALPNDMSAAYLPVMLTDSDWSASSCFLCIPTHVGWTCSHRRAPNHRQLLSPTARAVRGPTRSQ